MKLTYQPRKSHLKIEKMRSTKPAQSQSARSEIIGGGRDVREPSAFDPWGGSVRRCISPDHGIFNPLKSLGKSTEPLHPVLLTGSTVMSAAATSVTARVGAVASTACARVTHAAAAPRPRVAVPRKSVSALAFRRPRVHAHVTPAGKTKPGDAANDVANMDALIVYLIAAAVVSLV